MNIIWKDVKGYEGIYQVSNYGDIMRLPSYDSRGHLRNAKILKQRTTRYGYKQLGLNKDGKETKYLVHRIVADAFLDNPNNFTDINHKDENKQNNFVSNLEWCNRKYNCRYGTAQERRIKSRYHKEREEMKLCKEIF